MAKTIEFQYTNEKRAYHVTLQPDNPLTICEVRMDIPPYYRNLDQWQLTAYGVSVRKHGDRYDLEIGCRKALASALRKIDNRDLRRKIWEKYTEIFPIEKRAKPQEVDYLADLYQVIRGMVTA
jgi:hypothetical protein